MKSQVRERARSKRFNEFRRQRVTQLLAAGIDIGLARRFARLETEGRARVSFATSVDQALAASLDFTDGKRRDHPRFHLIYPPKA